MSLLLLPRREGIHGRRIRGGHLGADVRAPVRQLLPERRRLLRLERGQVPLLARIGGEVVQLDLAVLEPLDELPIPGPERARGTAPLVAVVRVMPVERALRDRAGPLEQRD